MKQQNASHEENGLVPYRRKMAARFLRFDRDGDGQITRDEFVAAAEHGLYGDEAAFAKVALSWHEAVFEAADSDGDGRVTPQQLRGMLVSLGADPDQAATVASERHTDADGLITEDQILRSVAAYYTTSAPPQRVFPEPGPLIRSSATE
ncbi:EF-hand domain-containing protein [Streptomyces sp. NBC_01565]|uniref:EF-hand domain-containing protein n=1 Tax=Streptomyces sp. NBC_01565 TaxID=2975881 RepID=UPI0022549322|nr:EF-hand domain-containing protein [Streptomyces sp. NBC_01565]MCX4546977.1 EF-hand domain-containing protein [Streptomyces sp. NBC_01565]